MTDQEITNDDVTDVEDLDDVEPHGLKEAMVGLSTAALVSGGVAGIVATQDATARTRHIQLAERPHLAMDDADAKASPSAPTAVASSPGTRDDGDAHPSDLNLRLQASVSASGVLLYGAQDDDPEDDVSAPTMLGDALHRTGTVVARHLAPARTLRDAALDTAAEAPPDTTAAAPTTEPTLPAGDAPLDAETPAV